jgi:uncharacterized protein with GYD domain
MGDFDVFAIAEGEDEHAICSLLLKAGSWGNVHSTTFRAFPKDEMKRNIELIESTP